MDTPDRVRVEGQALLFGFPSTPAVLAVRPRPVGWRVGGAAMLMVGFIVLALVVAIIPPHAPWLIGALVGGVILARRRWAERHTLESVDAACPKCGAPLVVKASRLRSPHPVTCEACHHESALRFDHAALPAA